MRMRHPLLTSLFCLLTLAACNTEGGKTTPPHSKWISRITEYHPTPGQFINTALGDMEAAEGIVGGKNGCVSLGGYGGYIIFEFDHEVQNIAGSDFVIFGNAFDGNSEPGIVEVSPDGERWYRLKGSEEHTEGTLLDYAITYTHPTQITQAESVVWTDNHGETGEVSAVSFHSQSYWPLFLSDDPQTLNFTGVKLPDNSSWNGVKYVQAAFAWGYADNWSADYGETVGDDPDTKNSNKFDLDNAVDKDGNPVHLTTIRQIKVYTAMNQVVGGGVGETSTEVCGALSLSANL